MGASTSSLHGLAYVAMATLMMGGQSVYVKWLFAHNISMESILLIRNATMLLCLLLLLFFQHRLAMLHHLKGWKMVPCLIGGILTYHVGAQLHMQSLHHISAGMERVLFFTFPAFLLLFKAVVEKLHVPRIDWVALALVWLGVGLTVGGISWQDISVSYLSGAGFALLNAAIFAYYVILNHSNVHRIGSMVFLTFAMLGGTLGMFTQAALQQTLVASLDIPLASYGWIMLFGLILVTSMSMLSQGMKVIGRERAAMITTLAPAIGVVLGYLILHETFALVQLVGAAIVLGAILCLELFMARARRAASQEP